MSTQVSAFIFLVIGAALLALGVWGIQKAKKDKEVAEAEGEFIDDDDEQKGFNTGMLQYWFAAGVGVLVAVVSLLAVIRSFIG